ncbi:MAG: tRNA N6-adenosine threonylcarbamoyltransferase [Leptospiraceae bacterium]|nr:MAG: tRNA N6-adenosine threonylcarbamoyltransferase [Leptospiraceae bacterium]
MIGLGIETSCDETSIALVKDGKEIISNIVYSQIKEHEKFYGVVPEIASRSHLIKINEVFEKAFANTSLTLNDIDYIAVTTRPGLIGSLMIGAQFAKVLHCITNKPIIDINHLEAHFYANFLDRKVSPTYPFLGLLLSGGNTIIYKVSGLNQLEIIGNTQDDAIGEAFDKAASILKIGYPGGPIIEKYAKKYKKISSNSYFSKILKDSKKDEITFSYSGIKTALLYLVKQNSNIDLYKICYDFQETCFELIIRMLKKAIYKTKINHIEAGGGVLANQRLRELLDNLAQELNIKIYYPTQKILCTDNGAMVATLGYYYFKNGYKTNLEFPVSSTVI